MTVLADDLTGANDTGLQFFEQGFSTRVVVNSERATLKENWVNVLNLETRSKNEEEARKCFEQFSTKLIDSESIVYKKVDSTFRGHIGVEIDALIEKGKFDLAIIAPSYPINGRVIRSGVQYVKEVPLHETQFAKDKQFPIETSSVEKLLESQSKHLTRHVGFESGFSVAEIQEEIYQAKRDGVKLLSFDTREQKDLDCIAAASLAVQERFFWVGSAGLANSLARVLKSKLNLHNPSSQDNRNLALDDSRFLGIVGSQNEASNLQVNYAERNGTSITTLDPLSLTKLGLKEVEPCSLHELEQIKDISVFSVQTQSSNSEEWAKYLSKYSYIGNLIAKGLGTLGSYLLSKHKINGIFLTGGDIAYQTCCSANIDTLNIVGRLDEGIPICIVPKGAYKGMIVVTKAGGFGKEDSLLKAINIINNQGGLVR
ncbi:four-carbon acid sugar kinase family protein [Thalassorhabdus alkalitolerans]|uniref:Four-carbon acid sugar kinase family protein n=1 Tax=Thalassorhabdus alkalitolerans TaxID=2282697 RepID=A0ABW0YP90_9BACI